MRALTAFFFGAALAVALTPVAVVSGPLGKAGDAYRRGDYVKAVRLARPLAEHRALYILATDIPSRIDPIVEPIVVRYSPFPRSRISKAKKTTFTMGGNTRSQNATTHSYMRGEAVGDEIVVTLEMEVGANLRGRDLVVEIRTSDRGEIQDVIIQGMDTPTNKSAAFEQQVTALFRALMPELPAGGVRTGDELFAVEFDFAGLTGGGQSMTATSSGTVRGLATYNGRRVLVVDMTMTIRSTMVSMNGTGFGVGLMDIENGGWLYSDSSMTMNMELEGERAIIVQHK